MGLARRVLVLFPCLSRRVGLAHLRAAYQVRGLRPSSKGSYLELVCEDERRYALITGELHRIAGEYGLEALASEPYVRKGKRFLAVKLD